MIIATIEARMGSSRLPGKILAEVCGKPILQHIVERLKRAKTIDKVVVATTTNPKDDATEALCRKIGCDFFRGSEDDVLSRLVGAARAYHADAIVQMTGDCPLLDPELVDHSVKLYESSREVDYLSNRLDPTYPCGLEVQVIKTSALVRTMELTQDPVDREHGSFYIYNHPELFKLKSFRSEELDCPKKRWVLDYPEDLKFIREIYEALYPSNPSFGTADILKLLKKRPELELLNSMHPVLVKKYV